MTKCSNTQTDTGIVKRY